MLQINTTSHYPDPYGPGYQFSLNSPDGIEGYYIGHIDLNDLSKCDGDGFNPLSTALGEYRGSSRVAIECAGELALYILEVTGNPNPKNLNQGFAASAQITPPIFHAIKMNLPEVVKKMIELRVDKNISITFFGTAVSGNPLQEAKKTDHKEIIQMLEEYYTE